MKKFYVYIHTCPNGKKYVGITTSSKPEYRWGKNGEGYRHQLFERAILKYGWDNITHEVFEVDSAEEMYRKEVELISFYHSNDPRYGYNNSTGGESGFLGCKHSEEARKKISEARKGKIFSEETRKKMSEANKGKIFSEETRKKIAETTRKNHLDPEYRKKLSETLKKKWTDPGYLKKQLEARKGKPHKPLPRVKIKLPDGTIVEITKQNLARDYIKKGRKFEYVS